MDRSPFQALLANVALGAGALSGRALPFRTGACLPGCTGCRCHVPIRNQSVQPRKVFFGALDPFMGPCQLAIGARSSGFGSFVSGTDAPSIQPCVNGMSAAVRDYRGIVRAAVQHNAGAREKLWRLRPVVADRDSRTATSHVTGAPHVGRKSFTMASSPGCASVGTLELWEKTFAVLSPGFHGCVGYARSDAAASLRERTSRRGDHRAAASRHHTLRTGIVEFDNGTGCIISVPCTIRDVSGTGARLQLNSSLWVAEQFTLVFSNGLRKDCRRLAQGEADRQRVRGGICEPDEQVAMMTADEQSRHRQQIGARVRKRARDPAAMRVPARRAHRRHARLRRRWPRRARRTFRSTC